MNEKDFKRLIELHSDDLFRYLAKSLGDTEQAKDAIATLGGEVVSNVSYKLNGTEPRSIVVVKKISQTPTQFPRKAKKISAKPL